MSVGPGEDEGSGSQSTPVYLSEVCWIRHEKKTSLGLKTLCSHWRCLQHTPPFLIPTLYQEEGCHWLKISFKRLGLRTDTHYNTKPEGSHKDWAHKAYDVRNLKLNLHALKFHNVVKNSDALSSPCFTWDRMPGGRKPPAMHTDYTHYYNIALIVSYFSYIYFIQVKKSRYDFPQLEDEEAEFGEVETKPNFTQPINWRVGI